MKANAKYRKAIAVAALMCFAAPALADVDTPSPIAMVKQAYDITREGLAHSGAGAVPPWRAPYRDKLFSKNLANLFKRDDTYQEESGEIGHLDADPFINGQDGEVKDLHVTVTGKASDRRTNVSATFHSFGQRQSVRFRMIEENGDWRIDDIIDRVDGHDYSIVEQLSQPYACGSFMHRPCQQ